MNELGKKITLRNVEYTVFEHNTVGIPYRLVNDNNKTYYLLLRDDRSDQFYFVNGLFATIYVLPKEEFLNAMYPPVDFSAYNFFSSGGSIVFNAGNGTGIKIP